MFLYYCGREMIKKLVHLVVLICLARFCEGLKAKGWNFKVNRDTDVVAKFRTITKAKKLPAELRIARATIIGCQHCSFVLKDFIELEMKLFHQVDFQEASGSDKRIIRFFNKNNDKLRDSDVTEVS